MAGERYCSDKQAAGPAQIREEALENKAWRLGGGVSRLPRIGCWSSCAVGIELSGSEDVAAEEHEREQEMVNKTPTGRVVGRRWWVQRRQDAGRKTQDGRTSQ